MLTTHTPAYHTTSLCCIPATQILGLGFSVFPFHSPLLRKSWLFSFPPLIKMLQFSGLILFKLRFINGFCVSDNYKLFLIYYFLTFLSFLNSQTTIVLICESKIINKQLNCLFICFFNKHSIKYASRNSYSPQVKSKTMFPKAQYAFKISMILGY